MVGKLFRLGTCRIDKAVFDVVNQNAINKKKGNVVRISLLVKVKKVDEIKAHGK